MKQKKTINFLIKIVFAIIFSVIVLAVALLFAFELMIPEDVVVESLPKYSSKEFYSSGGFQDTTDYAKYTYHISEEDLQNNEYLLPVESTDVPQIIAYIEDFEELVSVSHDFPSESYDFDKAIVSAGDYFYVSNRYQESEKAFWNYDLYYFDLESLTLYYFHSNI